MDTYPLSQYFDAIITALMTSAEKPEHAANFRASAYEAIASFVATCANDCIPTVEKLTMAILERLENTTTEEVLGQLVGSDDRRTHLELQANLCSVLTSITRRMGNHIRPLCDRIVQCLITIMSSANKTSSSTVMEDTFLTIGAVCMACEGDFLRYMDSFVPFLHIALSNHEEHAMCSIAVGIVGDICRSLNELMLPYCDSIMNALLNTLQSPTLHRDVKPVIISCFGDIALAIGSKYEAYVTLSMAILDQAGKSLAELDGDYTIIEYGNALREGIVEAYVGIVQGMKTGDTSMCTLSVNPGIVTVLGPYVPGIFQFVQGVASDPSRSESTTRALLGLLGYFCMTNYSTSDLAEAFPAGQLRNFFANDWVDPLIRQVKQEKMSAPTREVAKWLREMMKRQL